MSPNDDVTRVGFGAVIPRYGVEYSDAREQALRNEKLGFDSIWLTDHLQPPGIDGPVLETWTLLTALAMETERIRLGTMTICYSYRHPSVLAKMASTLDRISNGRLILAIGTGANSQVDENQALGIPYPRAPIRIEQLKEYVQVIKRLWGEGIADFHGKYYTLDGAKKNSPVLQKPTIPVWIGVRGPKMLRAVAEMGDSWNYHGHSAEEYAEAKSIVDSRCRELGKQENSLQSSVYGGIAVAKSEEELPFEAYSLMGHFYSDQIEPHEDGYYNHTLANGDEVEVDVETASVLRDVHDSLNEKNTREFELALATEQGLVQMIEFADSLGE